MALPASSPTAAGIDFDALYRSSRDDVFAYVSGILRDRSAAEDVTALAFERAFRRQGRFNPKRGEPRAWLFGIARNAALDELRKRRRSAELSVDPEDPAAEEAMEAGADVSLRRETVRAAMAQLEPREREVIALKFFGGLSNAELSDVLGVSQSNAGTILHRAVDKLRKACHVPS